MAQDLKKLFVYVPNNGVASFIESHTGNNITSSDEYYNKVSFLGGDGEIAARGELFGMSTEFKNKLGLTNDITTSSTLMAYVTAIKDSVATLNASNTTEGSVDKKIKTAIDNLIGGASQTYDTLKEIEEWLIAAQGSDTAANIAYQVAKVPTLEAELGTYSVTNNVGTYSGSYLFAHNAALDATNALSNTDIAVSGQYVSSVSLNNGTWTINRVNIPIIDINSTSANYLSITNQKLDALTSSISSTTGFTYTSTPASGHTSYEIGADETVGTGLVTASVVYARLRADETFVASALSTMDIRIKDIVNNTVGGLDETLVLTDSGSYITTTVVQQDGKLTYTGSSVTFDYAKIYAQLDSSMTITATENGTSYGSATIAIDNGKLDSTNSSLTINKTNILAKTEATITSPITGTYANAYIKVNVVTENHDVKSITVEFDPWEEYSV